MQPEVMGDLGDFTLRNHPPGKGDFEGDFRGVPVRGAPKSSLKSPTGSDPKPADGTASRLQPRSNRHPVDELADVRAEMRRLKAREDGLRDAILAGACGLVGDQHEASVRATEVERVDTAALRKELGLERLRPFLRKSVTQTVRVTEREAPEDP